MSAATLERRYHAALRWYPRAWRTANGDAIVGTLLDRADAQNRTTPRFSELADLALHGLGARLRVLGTPGSRAVRDHASVMALAMGVAFSGIMVVRVEVMPDRTPPLYFDSLAMFGPFASPMIVVYALWGIAFSVAMLGLTRASRVLIAASIPAVVVARLVADAEGMWLRPSATTSALFVMLALIVIAGRPVTRRSGRLRAVVALAASAAVFITPLALNPDLRSVVRDLYLVRHPAEAWLAMAPLVALVLAVVLRLANRDAWSGAVLVLAVPWAAIALFGGASWDDIVQRVLVGAALVLVVIGTLAVLRVWDVRITIRGRRNATGD